MSKLNSLSLSVMQSQCDKCGAPLHKGQEVFFSGAAGVREEDGHLVVSLAGVLVKCEECRFAVQS